MAENPAVAQAYIPASGATMTISMPVSLHDRPRPDPLSGWYTVVRNMGYEATDVMFDDRGELKSWRRCEDYPTYGEALDWLRDTLGYEARNGSLELKLRRVGNRSVITPAEWKMPGRLYFTSSSGLRIFDYAGAREGDLQDLDYHKLDLFRRIEAEGYDGIRINDFVKTKIWGSVHHQSVGLFGRALASREFEYIEATNFDWDDDLSVTETREWRGHLNALDESDVHEMGMATGF